MRVSGPVFTKFLIDKLGLRVVVLRAEQYGTVRRYGWRDFSPHLMALSIRSRSYISHGTAVFLHGLNDQLPKTIYVNQEQSEKPKGGGLTQERLNLAFSRRQRTSKYVYAFDSYRAVLLSGKQTGAYGVVLRRGPQREELRVTGIARTLVDIAVRPAYSGGIVQVLEAYRGAKGKVRGAEIVRVLKRLDYVYPYHQAIGFLMERAGYAEAEWEKLRSLGTKFDFYLLHGLKAPKRDAKWRLFFPEGL
ncbi:MAG: type IV toxin-antitoxin system AbiEi family antitoxin [Candidatus Eisenbacteria bacterium]